MIWICTHGTCTSWATRSYHVFGSTVSTRGTFTYGSGCQFVPKTLHLCDKHALADVGVAWGAPSSIEARS